MMLQIMKRVFHATQELVQKIFRKGVLIQISNPNKDCQTLNTGEQVNVFNNQLYK